MTHPSKRKGNEYEREIVRDAEAVGLEAERAYASDGRSLGEAEECDVLIRGRDDMVLEAVRVQAKRRKSVANYLQPPEGADINVVRENYGDSLAVVPWDLFLELLREASDGGEEPQPRGEDQLDELRSEVQRRIDTVTARAERNAPSDGEVYRLDELRGLLELLNSRTDPSDD